MRDLREAILIIVVRLDVRRSWLLIFFPTSFPTYCYVFIVFFSCVCECVCVVLLAESTFLDCLNVISCSTVAKLQSFVPVNAEWRHTLQLAYFQNPADEWWVSVTSITALVHHRQTTTWLTASLKTSTMTRRPCPPLTSAIRYTFFF